MKKSNNKNRLLRPKTRMKIRIIIGKCYYTTKRYLWWLFGKHNFARKHEEIRYNHECFKHKTPLLRKLKDVDMFLQYNKITNLKIAVDRLNCIVIHPGETFSYWKNIGNPTAKKGYVEGMILFCGSYGTGIGGGLCQLSNLIYWITLHTPLTVTERYRHSFDVFPDSNRSQPFGSGATCVYNYRDLMIRNDTAASFQLLLEVTETELIGKWKSDKPLDNTYKVYEKDHRMDSEYWGGFSRNNTLYRKVYDTNGNEIDDQYITENHAHMMYNPFIETKK